MKKSNLLIPSLCYSLIGIVSWQHRKNWWLGIRQLLIDGYHKFFFCHIVPPTVLSREDYWLKEVGKSSRENTEVTGKSSVIPWTPAYKYESLKGTRNLKFNDSRNPSGGFTVPISSILRMPLRMVLELATTTLMDMQVVWVEFQNIWGSLQTRLLPPL